MPIIERDVVLTGQDALGQTTMDFPVTRLGLVEGDAEVKGTPAAGDYLPVLDGQKMKKMPFEALQKAINDGQSAASASGPGLLSAEDKKKLDGIAAGATQNTASSTTPKALGTASAGSEDGYSRGDHVHPKPTPDDLGAVPTTRKVNNKALSEDISLTAEDVGALPSGSTAAAAAKLAAARNIDGVAFDGSAAITHYYLCSTAGNVAQKEVTMPKLSLVTGAEITVRFTYANTAANPTLSVNGVAAAIRAYGSTAAGPGSWKAGEAVRLVFATATGAAGGGYWYIEGGGAAAQIGEISSALDRIAEGIKIFSAGKTAPTDKNLLWIDTTATTGGLKYHNGTAWVHVPVAAT